MANFPQPGEILAKKASEGIRTPDLSITNRLHYLCATLANADEITEWENGDLRNDNLARCGFANHFIKRRFRAFDHGLRTGHLHVDIAPWAFKNGPVQGVVFQGRRGTAGHAA